MLERPRVIPIRASTPVTALRFDAGGSAPYLGDGLGAIRGLLAHRAIELRFSPQGCPPLEGLIDGFIDRPLDRPTRSEIADEVEAMLEKFEAGPLAATLRRDDVEKHFELPFAWDWDGLPVHGTIDLAYRDEIGWHVVDFKTDSIRGRQLAEVAQPYPPQLGLYGRALEAATGERPSLHLAFLRVDTDHRLDWVDVDAALVDARERVDGGALLDPAEPLEVMAE